ncbi:hypothetical protein DYB32_005122 [Aphanomyces invadans]|uniref:BTB domain-containing protein n=1 Tax=Aphanomyces invadans TaxID=157072 RepID=A0A3R6VWZ4_9STRA|nr:hypothetical protein DYB32_005122 [Aphanomyces invadans]
MGGFFPSQVLLRHQCRDESLRLHRQNVWRPRVQQFPISIVDISCAPQHSIGLCALGNVYVWGHGPNPLAVGGRHYIPLNDRATSIAAAKEHCAVVLASGDVYTWGCGTLGHEGRNWLPTPKRVANIKQAKSVAAGPHHHVVLVTPKRPLLDESCGDASLVDKCQHVLRQQVSLQTVVSIYAKADMLDMSALKTLCRQFVTQNLDAVLEMTRNADEWPIELSDEACQRQRAISSTSSQTTRLGTWTESPIKKDLEKKLRSLQKRVDQLREIELLVAPTDAQKAKLKRKPNLLSQIVEIKAQLPSAHKDNAITKSSDATRPTSISPSTPVNIPSSIVKTTDLKKKKQTKHVQAALEQDSGQKKQPVGVAAAESKSTHEKPASSIEMSKPTATHAVPAEETKPQRKARTKFVPLNSFLDAQLVPTPALPPLNSAWSPSPVMLLPSPPSLPLPMKLSSSPAASPMLLPTKSGTSVSSASGFTLESFMKPSRKSKKAGLVEIQGTETASAPWQTLESATTIHSLAAIQAAEAVQVKQTWNLKKNQWGLCHNENVNLAAIQSIELEEKQQIDAMIAQDCELAKKLQAEELDHARRHRRGGHGEKAQTRPRSKRHGSASVRAA